jgi:hypothetical protein
MQRHRHDQIRLHFPETGAGTFSPDHTEYLGEWFPRLVFAPQD